MGSNLVPGTGSFGNPAGMDVYGLNPLGDAENLRNLASFNPGEQTRTANVLGSSLTTGSPFAVTPRTASPFSSLVPNGGTDTPVAPVLPPNSPATVGAPNPVVPTTNPFAVAAPGGNPNTYKAPNNGVAAPNNGSAYGYPTFGNGLPEIVNPGAGTLDWKSKQQLQDVYGEGLGNTLFQTLATGAGYNSQVTNSFIHAIQPYFQSNMGNIMSMFGAAGQRFSSTAALAAGKMSADFTAQEEQIMAQMYMWAYQNYLSVLMGTSKDYMNFGSGGDTMSTINDILGLTKVGAGAASIGLAAAGGGGGTVGAILAGLAAV